MRLVDDLLQYFDNSKTAQLKYWATLRQSIAPGANISVWWLPTAHFGAVPVFTDTVTEFSHCSNPTLTNPP